MRLELTGRHVEITPTLRRLVGTKLAKVVASLGGPRATTRAADAIVSLLP